MRAVYFWSYFIASIGIAIATLQSMDRYLPNTYAIGVEASKGLPLLIFGNLIVSLMIGIGKIIMSLTFGELRLIEFEHIHERTWPTLMGLGMSAAIYSKHENPLFLIIMVLGILVTKVFHWITMDRLEMLIQKYHMHPNSTIKGVIFNRSVLIALILLKMDYTVISSFIDESLTNQQELMLVMAFEYFLVGMVLTKAFFKFGVNVFELHYIKKNPEEEVWEYKAWVLAIFEIIMSIINALMIPTMFFFFISLGVVPVNLAGDIFVAFLDLTKSVGTIMMLHQTRKKLQNAVSDPTIEDIEKDDICIVCRDEMVIGGFPGNSRSVPKKIPCGHVLHIGCLKSWLERTNGCPMCRKPVIIKVKNKAGTTEIEPNDQGAEIQPEDQQPLEQEEQLHEQHVPDINALPEQENTANPEPAQTQPIQAQPNENNEQDENNNIARNFRNMTIKRKKKTLDDLIDDLEDVNLPENFNSHIEHLKQSRNNELLNRTNKRFSFRISGNDLRSARDWTSIKKYKRDDSDYLDYNEETQIQMTRIIR